MNIFFENRKKKNLYIHCTSSTDDLRFIPAPGRQNVLDLILYVGKQAINKRTRLTSIQNVVSLFR